MGFEYFLAYDSEVLSQISKLFSRYDSTFHAVWPQEGKRLVRQKWHVSVINLLLLSLAPHLLFFAQVCATEVGSCKHFSFNSWHNVRLIDNTGEARQNEGASLPFLHLMCCFLSNKWSWAGHPVVCSLQWVSPAYCWEVSQYVSMAAQRYASQ